MEAKDVIALLNETGIKPVFYSKTTTATALPFIAYEEDEPDQFFADGINYSTSKGYIVRLCTAIKDPAKEKLLEDVFRAHEIPFERTGTPWVSEEKYYMTTYFI